MIKTLVIEHMTSPFVVLTRTYLCPPSWHRQHLPTSLTHQHCLHTPTISTLLCPRLHFLLGRVLICLIQRISFLLHIGQTLGMRILNGFYSIMVDTCSLVVPEVSYPRICKANGQKMVITCGAVVGFWIHSSIFHTLTKLSDRLPLVDDPPLVINFVYAFFICRLKHQHPDELLGC
jgi:hypothetical protein